MIVHYFQCGSFLLDSVRAGRQGWEARRKCVCVCLVEMILQNFSIKWAALFFFVFLLHFILIVWLMKAPYTHTCIDLNSRVNET